jgi:hypothetical protein
MLVRAAFIKGFNVGYILTFTLISFAVAVGISTCLVDCATTALPLHATLVFTTGFLLLILFLVGAGFINVCHYLSL